MNLWKCHAVAIAANGLICTETRNLAINLRILRDRKGLSGPAVAARLGIKSNRLGHWETGFASPDYTMLIKLCDLYGFKDIYKLLTEVV